MSTGAECPVCHQPIDNGRHTQISAPRPVGVNVAESRWYCGTAAQFAEELGQALSPTRSYELTDAVERVRARDNQTARERFFNEALGEPFAEPGEK